jgi:hypothetical protein
MPLSPPAERKKLHTRTIVIDGYEREDGLFDVEAHLTDVKAYSFENEHRGRVPAGRPLHDMLVRLTFDERMTIVAAEASTEVGPYDRCAGGAASYASLVGLRIRPGFLKEANARMAGPAGCTHQREMLQEIATTALQSMWAVRSRREAAARAAGGQVEPENPHRLLNTCHAYASDSPVVQERWPQYYTGPVVPIREAELAARRAAAQASDGAAASGD